MRLNRVVPMTLLAGAFALAACDTTEPGLTIADFQGNWTASSVVYTSHEGPGDRILDIVTVGGGLTLNLDATGNYTGVLTMPGPQQIPITGSVTLVSDTQADVDFNWPQGVPPQIEDFRATFTLSGNTLTFSRTDATFAFPGQTYPDGVSGEGANLFIAMSRS